MEAKVTRLRTPPARTLRSAAEAYLDTIGSANTLRAYGIAIVKTVDAPRRRPESHHGWRRRTTSPTALST